MDREKEKRVRVLVTGGAGFIGSFLCERLLALGHAVRVLDNLDPQVHPAGAHPETPPDVELCREDVRDPAACRSALDHVDVVVHCAAAVGVAQSMYRVGHYIDVNVAGTATLLEALIGGPPIPKLVVLSSMTGYGEGVYRRPSDDRLLRVGIRTEQDIERFGWDPVCPDTGEPLKPHPTPEGAELLCRNVYAFSKRYQEELALALGSAYRFPVVCLRLFNVFGPRQSLSNPYTGVADGQVVNIGSGSGRSIHDIARTLAHLTRRDDLSPQITERYRRGDVRHSVADIAVARRLLAFEPKVRWEDGLAEVVEWARSSPSVDRTTEAIGELEARGLVSSRQGHRQVPR